MTSSTYTLISDLLPLIWEGALNYAQYNFVMPQLISVFNDRQGMVARKVSEYIETSVLDSLAETDDLSSEAYDRDLLATLTPKEIGKQFTITDRRIESDTENVLVDAARDIGYAIGKKLEQDLMANFASLTGGVFGAAGTAMSLSMLYNARARLEAAAVPGPYVVVLHPYQYLDIFNEFTNLSSPAPLDIRNEAQRSYYVTRVADFNVVVSGLVPIVGVTNEVQTLTITGTPTGGTFTITFGGQTTDPIAYNASAAAVELAFEALPNVGAGNGTCAGGALPGTPVTITFTGALAGVDVPLATADGSGLTGGTTPDAAIALTTSGANYARAAMFSRDSMALDLRRGFYIEPERDASLRATELNSTMIYGTGVWRATRGIILKSDASLPLT